MPTPARLLPLAAALLLLAACGKQEAPPAPAAAPAPAPAPTAAAEVDAKGKSTYGMACAMCHAAGVAGAPKPGDKAEWAPRIGQGMDTLYKHSLEGFTGGKGAMPPKGGNAALADADVRAAVDYMVALSR